MVSVVAISTPELYSRGRRTVAKRRKYRATVDHEARIFFAMLACIADATHHAIVQRDCNSFKRIDMIIVI
jgi:hypothetical protein